MSFYQREDRARLQEEIDRCLRNGEDYWFTGLIETFRGERVWLRSIGRPIYRAGEPIGFRGVCQDVSREKMQEKQLLDQGRRLRRAMESGRTGFFEWRLDNHEVFWDRSCCLLNGLDREEHRLSLEEVREMIYPDDLADWEAGVSKIQKIGDIHGSEHRMIGFDDKVRWIRSRSELIESATGAPFLLGTCTDVTELRESMIELLAAKEEADQANQAKSEFLSLMNHELRTPLNTIIAPCELALGQAQDELIREMLEMAVTSGRHLLDLINRVLDLSKIEAGRFEEEKESIELSKFLQEFLKPFESLAEKENCSLELVVDPRIESVDLDPAVIRQMLFNLIGNAIKYAPGKPIKVEVSLFGYGLLFEVIDRGAGISLKEQQRVFDGFSRGGGPESKTKEGVGLGLRICKKLAEAAGGKLDLESIVGEGSVFRFFCLCTMKPSPKLEQAPVRYRRRMRSQIWMLMDREFS